MSKEYIARDPRTGKPLNVSRSKSKKQYIETEQGPWMAIPDLDIIPLAIGEIEECKIPWRSKDYHLTRKDGIMALTRIKGARANEAHKALLLGLEDDEPQIRVASLKALPELPLRNLMNCLIGCPFCLMMMTFQ